MDFTLLPIETRVLGSLVEKELTTPEYYPLSLNSLTAACNQKNNRDPVMNLSEDDVREAIETLRARNLAWQLNTAGGRVPKFEHNLPAKFGFSQDELSVVTVMLLRGPLTPGEIRGCTGRMYGFKDLTEVESTLQKLVEMEHGPFVVKLPREPGKKENRFAHLFSGEIVVADAAAVNEAESGVAGVLKTNSSERIVALEEKVGVLTNELSELKQAFESFKKSFE